MLEEATATLEQMARAKHDELTHGHLASYKDAYKIAKDVHDAKIRSYIKRGCDIKGLKFAYIVEVPPDQNPPKQYMFVL